MNRLWVAAALAPLTFAAAQANAQEIKTSQSTPVVSSGETVKIDSGVSITPTASGTASAQAAAVTQNTSPSATVPSGGTANSVANNGSISYTTGENYVTGILINGAAGSFPASEFGSVGNAGTISLTETTSYKDTNNDGIIDSNGSVAGQFAAGSNRYGIQTAGAMFQGAVGNAGSISIIGENSAGILIGSGGISQGLSNLGTISVTGGNAGTNDTGTDVSYGINAQGPLGSVVLGGTISALGKNAIGVNLAGPITGFTTTTGTTTTATPGAVNVSGSITATGYRSTTAPTVPSVLALVQQQAASELLQGGPALAIGGNVAGGVSINAPTPATTSSGSTVAAVAGATLTSYGRAPALLIGSGSGTVQLGQFGTSGYGLVLGGNITGAGVYSLDDKGASVGANAVQIGVGYVNNTPGTGQGLYSQAGSQQVQVFGGLNVTGGVTAIGISRQLGSDGEASVTALHLGDVAITTPASVTTNGVTYGAALNVHGTISASIQTGANIGATVTAVQIDSGAQVPSLYNAGTIAASVSGIPGILDTPAAGGRSGKVAAIVDKSGNLTSVTNAGVIATAITPIDPTQSVDTTNSYTHAIDLSANTTGATVTQVQGSAFVGPNGTTTSTTPAITGDILFGSGNGTLDIQAGTVIGGIQFGAAAGNQLSVNSATVVGELAEKAGGSLSIDVGTKTGATTSILAITQPTTNTLITPASGQTVVGQTINVGNVHIGPVGELILSVNPQSPVTELNASGAVLFEAGAKLGLNFTEKLTGSTQFNLITAGANQVTLNNLSGAPGSGLGSVPYLYNVSVAATNNNSDVTLSVSQKTAAELGFNKAEAAAYSAVYTAFSQTDPSSVGAGTTQSALLGATDRSSFLKAYDQFLPDYSGGPFEDLVLAQQSLARTEADSPEKLDTDGSRGWVQEITYYDSRANSAAVNGYNSKGFGFAGGTEQAYGHQAVGLAVAFVDSSVHDLARSDGSSQGAAAIEAGAYWRSNSGGLSLSANVNGGWASLESRRVLMQQSGTAAATLYRLAKANWMGGIASGSLNASYKEAFGRYYIKPEVSADYVMLYEQGFHEHGGGDAYDLTVHSKLSKEAVVQADTVIGATYGVTTKWSPELTVGYRDVVYGGPANTTAHFNVGGPFTLSPDYLQKGGLVARLGLRASGNFADFNASAGGIFRSGYTTYDARAAARFLF